MVQCTFIFFVGNKPFVIPPVKILPEKRYERIIWTEKGEIYYIFRSIPTQSEAA